MKVFFVLPFLIMGVLATDFHSIAVRMLTNSTMCNNDSLVKIKEEILHLIDTERFNASARSGTRWLGLNKDEIAPETIFECVLTFFENDQSPLCKYLAHEKIDDCMAFLNVLFDSFRYHPQLETYAHHAFEGKRYSISHPPIYTHLETARFYSLYCRHPISNELSFNRIFTLFDYSRLELFSCPELQTRLNEIFARKKFRRAIERMESNSARMYELFYNHLYSDEKLMFKVFDYLVEHREFDQELRFKQIIWNSRPSFKFNEFAEILFVNSLMNYQFDISKIYHFTSPLVKDEKERNEFFSTLLFKFTLKQPSCGHPLKFGQCVKSYSEYFFHISSIFNSSDNYLIADNLIRQFRRVKYTTPNIPPWPLAGFIEKSEKFINRIANAYGIDPNAVEEEFPLEFQQTQEGNEQLEEFFKFQRNLIKNTKWK